MKIFSIPCIVLVWHVISVTVSACSPSYGYIPNPWPNPDPVSPNTFTVTFDTNITINGTKADPIVIEVIREWAPLGADRFHSLVQDHYYECAAFFRVVPDFVVQFGIAVSELVKYG